MDVDPEQPTRKRIVDFVGLHPGASARDIQRGLSLGWGETAYHLDQLLSKGAIVREKGGRRHFYFPVEFGPEPRQLLAVFQNRVQRALLLELSRERALAFSELAAHLSIARSTLAFHLRLLIAAGLVKIASSGQTPMYQAERPSLVLFLYARYKDAWGSRWVDGFASTFGGLIRE